MAEMTGAQAMYALLAREGVRYVFGNPGTTELPLMEMFAERDEITYILALHEDSALGIAAGYADATGLPAVVNLHTNVGLAHALGNLYNAYRAGTPLIVTAGQQATCSLVDEPLLCADMIELARQHTKWAWEVRSAAEIPKALARAFKIARSKTASCTRPTSRAPCCSSARSKDTSTRRCHCRAPTGRARRCSM